MRMFKRFLSVVLTLALAISVFECSFENTEAQAAAKPAKPSVSATAGADGKSINISVAKTKDAAGYKILVKKPGSDKYVKLTTIKKDGTAERSYTAKKLDAGTYSFKVRAYAKSGNKTVWGKYSKVVSVTLKKAVSKKDRKVVEFGSYKQEATKFDNGYPTEFKTSPIEWIVLKEDSDKMLLLSKEILEFREITWAHNGHTRWDESSIRRWLNDEFMNTAFTDDEKEKIIETELVTGESPAFSTDGKPDGDDYFTGDSITKDKVFLLSTEDVLNKEYGLYPDYLTFDDVYDLAYSMSWMWNYTKRLEEAVELRCSFTDYALYTDGLVTDIDTGDRTWQGESSEYSYDYVKNNSQEYAEGRTAEGKPSYNWWLRTPGNRKRKLYQVSASGALMCEYDECKEGIRPAVWVKK